MGIASPGISLTNSDDMLSFKNNFKRGILAFSYFLLDLVYGHETCFTLYFKLFVRCLSHVKKVLFDMNHLVCILLTLMEPKNDGKFVLDC